MSTEYQVENEARPEWYKRLLIANSFERVTLEDRLRAMPQQLSTAHGIETPHVFQVPAKPAVKPRAPQRARETGLEY